MIQPAVNLMKGKYIILMLKYLQKKKNKLHCSVFPKTKMRSAEELERKIQRQ